MLSELLHHRHTPYSILVDIGSGSVGVAVVESDGNHDEPLILYTHRERIRITKSKTEEDLIRTLREALLAATLELSSSGMKALASHDPHGRIDHVDVLYASPWCEVITRIIALDHKESFKTTSDMVETMIDEALKHAGSPAHEQAIFESTGKAVIHRAIIDSMVNGYPVTSFTGQEANELKIAYMTELVPQVVRDTLSEAEKNLSAHAPLVERSFVAATYCVSRRLYPDERDALLIEVTGEATECAVIEDSVLYENFSALFGVHSFYRLVGDKLGTIEEEAASHVRDFLQQTARADVREVIMQARESYKKQLEKVFDAIREEYALPNDLIITLDADTAPLFAPLIEEAYATCRSEHTTHMLDHEALEPLVLYANAAIHDHYLSIGAFFFHTKHRKVKPN